MAGRGGWGRGGPSFQRYIPPVPFVNFPEDINLPDAKPDEIDRYTKKLLQWDNKFNGFYKAAPYYLEKEELKGRKRMHVETYSDRQKKTKFTRDSLSQVLHFDGFAKELIPGQKMRRSQKKMRWNPEADMKQKTFFDELEKRLKKEEGKVKKENEEEEEESEDEDENEEEESEGGDFNDGDYNQNADFDDDEDDYNDVEAGHDEDIF